MTVTVRLVPAGGLLPKIEAMARLRIHDQIFANELDGAHKPKNGVGCSLSELQLESGTLNF